MTEEQPKPLEVRNFPTEVEFVLHSVRHILDQLLALTVQLTRDTDLAAKERREAIQQIMVIVDSVKALTEAVRAMAKTLDSHYSETIQALMGKQQIPLAIHMKILQLIGWMLAITFAALVVSVTGQNLNVLPNLFGQ